MASRTHLGGLPLAPPSRRGPLTSVGGLPLTGSHTVKVYAIGGLPLEDGVTIRRSGPAPQPRFNPELLPVSVGRSSVGARRAAPEAARLAPFDEHLLQTPRWVDFLKAKSDGFGGSFDEFAQRTPAHRGPRIEIDYRRAIFGSSLGTFELASTGEHEVAVLNAADGPRVSRSVTRGPRGNVQADFGDVQVFLSARKDKLRLKVDDEVRSAKITAVEDKLHKAPKTASVLAGGWVAQSSYRGGPSEKIATELEFVQSEHGQYGLRFAKIPNDELAAAVSDDLVFWFDDNGKISRGGAAGERRVPAGNVMDSFPKAALNVAAQMVDDHPAAGLWVDIEIVKGSSNALFGSSIDSRLQLCAMVPKEKLPLGLDTLPFKNVETAETVAHTHRARQLRTRRPLFSEFYWSRDKPTSAARYQTLFATPE